MPDAFVTALTSAGTAPIYTTSLGGSELDSGWGIALDARGSASVTGQTDSTNVPLVSPAQSSYSGGSTDAFVARLNPPERITHSTYDGLLRLIGAVETPGSTSASGYDAVGNRTAVQVNGSAPIIATYDLADQRVGGTYDALGNLLSDGAATYTYDARMACHALIDAPPAGSRRLRAPVIRRTRVLVVRPRQNAVLGQLGL